MLNLVQHLRNSRTYETLKRVQGDKSGLFTRPSSIGDSVKWKTAVFGFLGGRGRPPYANPNAQTYYGGLRDSPCENWAVSLARGEKDCHDF